MIYFSSYSCISAVRSYLVCLKPLNQWLMIYPTAVVNDERLANHKSLFTIWVFFFFGFSCLFIIMAHLWSLLDQEDKFVQRTLIHSHQNSSNLDVSVHHACTMDVDCVKIKIWFFFFFGFSCFSKTSSYSAHSLIHSHQNSSSLDVSVYHACTMDVDCVKIWFFFIFGFSFLWPICGHYLIRKKSSYSALGSKFAQFGSFPFLYLHH